jgi:hypothetical protein
MAVATVPYHPQFAFDEHQVDRHQCRNDGAIDIDRDHRAFPMAYAGHGRAKHLAEQLAQSGQLRVNLPCPLWADSRLMHCSNWTIAIAENCEFSPAVGVG